MCLAKKSSDSSSSMIWTPRADQPWRGFQHDRVGMALHEGAPLAHVDRGIGAIEPRLGE